MGRAIACAAIAAIVAHAPAASAAGEGLDVVSFTILDAAGDAATPPLVAGRTYTVEAVYEFSTSLNDRVLLETACERSGSAYWRLAEPFPGIDPASFQPGNARIPVEWTQGTLRLGLTCALPAALTESTQGGETLHKPLKDFALLVASVESTGAPLASASRRVGITDDAVIAFEAARADAVARLASLEDAPRALREKATRLLALADALAGSGRVDSASAAAASVPGADDVPDPGSGRAYLILAGALGLATVGALVLLAKARGDLARVAAARQEAHRDLRPLVDWASDVDPEQAQRVRAIMTKLGPAGGAR